MDWFFASVNAMLYNVNRGEGVAPIKPKDLLMYDAEDERKGISIYDVEQQTAAWSAVSVRR